MEVISAGALPEPVREPVARAVQLLVDSETCLLAVTGSLASGTWRECWSDVDVLLVRRTLPYAWLTRTEADPNSYAQVSAFSAAEVSAGAIPPRVLNALRLVAGDNRGVLHRDAHWELPQFDLATGSAASMRDLPQALLLLRRQLMSRTFDLRTVYKLIILVARIRLRSRGLEPDSSDGVIAGLADADGLDPTWLPSLDQVVPARLEISRGRPAADHPIQKAVSVGAALLLGTLEQVEPVLGAPTRRE